MLYKFIGSNDPNDVIKNLKRFIEEGTISASAPTKFNDPSECKVSIVAGETPEEREKFYESFEITSLTKDEWENASPQVVKNTAVVVRNEVMNMFGVVCLTPVVDSILMWSHYSASHKGFCIGFEDAFVKSIDDYFLFDAVRYMSCVPVCNMSVEGIQGLAQKLFFYKDSCWFYENERRVITSRNGIKTFDKKYIREVCLGHNADPLVEAYVKEAAKNYPDIKFYKMRTDDDDYRLIRESLI
ncbi:DUF2971 domain-containing protein [Cronobacter sakazakii]|nr:DUF2971 domain-containing protein [Cronobacter sakazakii]